FERFGLPLLVVEVAAPGVIAALNAGFARTSGEIIAVTDDDARPRPDWVLRLEAHFRADAAVGGVGGRDRIGGVGDVPDGGRRRVGTVQWWGRRLGNHHLGVGGPRVVDILKGVNMSFRRLAIQGMEFDSRMRGEGAQPHFEVEFSLRLRRRGWKLIYDPDAAVDHFPGALTAGDHRARRHPRAVTDAVHNETVALLEHLSFARRLVFWVWAVAVGTRCAPGLVQWLRFLPSEPVWTTRKLAASLRGRYAAVLTRRAALVARNDS
ncbi:MAG: glycosyltransferase family 2 protein, partial [Candidatus Dormibacteria bacterium]